MTMIKQQSLYQLENTDLKLLTAYCIQNQPSTSSLLGWLLNSPQSCPNEFSNAIFYCSAPNPWALIAQNQTVVWLIEIKDRIRIFVSSEPFLDQCPTTDLAVKYCEDPETSLQGPMFIAADHQALYKESENLLEQLLKTFMENKKEILVHGCSVIWSPLLRRLFKIPYNGPCKRFVNPASKYPLPCSLRNGYSIAKAEKKHAPLIIEYNKIKFEMQYVIEGLEMSTVITTQDNTPVAWAMSHRDL
ncbi:hypothetical protein PHYBLDRAFT_159565 [Phycomyces blakesleeanus NRRL 1555(-)]|uniref:Uncharacterized protein n=2 Tax=Phycomyces blakesleeanus TaxID=4837 RepID=A0A167LJL3_PHYB8|nr:hypothetical protein PHYBLDRAFT_159565 [Phycomyces blakesleeanus NRRL 1555(-)]OAD70604.1 hypothetical protein PHYBLDRAFT_159565 [Phycomyces blakesleeanus NRRL 1555(-)]|eukprot:XP_018288644.1 hypothetical protein PHYBLDRAFT_159565 [Phycomyces blakesleeanus NRRL 1555(-)]